ncbi:MAG TPA: hypothetical protein PK566_17600 [Pseudobacteroides sp.]|nr:hypothetical protein [Pseudobacteroides sp.]
MIYKIEENRGEPVSVFGILSIIFIMGMLFIKRIKIETKLIACMCIVFIYILFVFNDYISFYGNHSIENLISIILAIIFSTILFIKTIKRPKKFLIILTYSLVIIIFLYTEFFNGIFTFKNYNEFFEVRSKVARHYFLFPYKIVDMENLPEEKFSSVYYNFYRFSELKIHGNDIYYRNPKFGETGIWFKFGIPESEQV